MIDSAPELLGAVVAHLVTPMNLAVDHPGAYARIVDLERTEAERAQERLRELLLRAWANMPRRDIRGSRKRKEAMRAMRRIAREVLAARG